MHLLDEHNLVGLPVTVLRRLADEKRKFAQTLTFPFDLFMREHLEHEAREIERAILLSGQREVR